MILFLLIFPIFAFSKMEVTINQMNGRFMSVTTPSKFVKIVLLRPVQGLSIYSVEIKTSKEKFDFISRRAVPWNEAYRTVIDLRRFIKTHNKIEVIGNMASRDKLGDYYSMWELVRSSKNDCLGYFGECEKFERTYPEWSEWQKTSIDPKIYP